MKPLKLLFFVLPAGLLLTAFFALPPGESSSREIVDTDKLRKIRIVSEKQVGKDGASTKFSYFSTSPESPNGKKVIYLRLKKEPIGVERKALVPGELWICNRDLKGHRLVTEIKGMSSEDGCRQQWVSDNHVALLDNGIVRVIDVRNGQNILKKGVEAQSIGHDSFNGNILFTRSGSQHQSDPGVYELNCFTGTIKPVLLNVACRGVSMPPFLDPDLVFPVEDWRMLHCQYSPNGKKICFRVDTGPSEKYQLLGVCNMDGTDFSVQVKALHHMWYDNESIMGHGRFDENGVGFPPEKKFNLMRWDLHGKYLETMGPRGNHLGASPNRDYFATETMYYKSPVILTLYPKGKIDEAVQIAKFDPYDLTWNRYFHVNPAFSRDGKRIYYCRPLNDKYSGTFACDIKVE